MDCQNQTAAAVLLLISPLVNGFLKIRIIRASCSYETFHHTGSNLGSHPFMGFSIFFHFCGLIHRVPSINKIHLKHCMKLSGSKGQTLCGYSSSQTGLKLENYSSSLPLVKIFSNSCFLEAFIIWIISMDVGEIQKRSPSLKLYVYLYKKVCVVLFTLHQHLHLKQMCHQKDDTDHEKTRQSSIKNESSALHGQVK